VLPLFGRRPHLRPIPLFEFVPLFGVAPIFEHPPFGQHTNFGPSFNQSFPVLFWLLAVVVGAAVRTRRLSPCYGACEKACSTCCLG
jgi:hypothetical protein